MSAKLDLTGILYRGKQNLIGILYRGKKSADAILVGDYTLPVPPANFFLLLEDGFYVLQEDGSSKIILEP